MKRIAATVLAIIHATPLAAQVRPSVAPKSMQEVAPQLADYTDRVLFGDVWLRPDLSPRDRSLVVLSVLVATGKTAQMSGHLNRGIANGLTPAQISGLVTHLAFYTGWPNAVSATSVVEQVFAERKIDTSALRKSLTEASNLPVAVTDAPSINEAKDASKFTDLTKTVIFDSLWRRSDLSPRDRSLVTIAALAALGDGEQLGSYIARGRKAGLTCAEIGEALTHLAFYAGWPKATSAISIADDTFSAERASFTPTTPGLDVIPSGQQRRAGPASNFVGLATVTSPFNGTGHARLGGATVNFEAGARTNWHIHPVGQLLVVTDGHGWVQAEGEPVRLVKSGDVVWTGPGVKHWHGATRSTDFKHVAVAETAGGAGVTWLEPVQDHQYRGPFNP